MRLPIVLICLVFALTLHAQKRKDPHYIPDRLIGRVITYHHFKKQVARLIRQTADTVSKKEARYYKQYFRCINTISKYHIGDKYVAFTDTFNKRVIPDCFKSSILSFYKGGAMYSYTYNVFVGGPRHKNSRYWLIGVAKAPRPANWVGPWHPRSL